MLWLLLRMSTGAHIVELNATPSAQEVYLTRCILGYAGVDPYNRAEVLHLATYGVSPLHVVTAAAHLAITFDCPMGCGRKLDPSNKDALGLDLCPECLEEAETENAHSDGYHADDPDPGCPGMPRLVAAGRATKRAVCASICDTPSGPRGRIGAGHGRRLDLWAVSRYTGDAHTARFVARPVA